MGDETLRPQDTSAPRHIGTGAEVSEDTSAEVSEDTSAPVLECPGHFGTAFRNLHVSSRQPMTEH